MNEKKSAKVRVYCLEMLILIIHSKKWKNITKLLYNNGVFLLFQGQIFIIILEHILVLSFLKSKFGIFMRKCNDKQTTDRVK